MASTFQSETGRLLRVIMKHPEDAIGSQGAVDAQWEDLCYLARPDYDTMCRQADTLMEILAELGTEVVRLPEVEGPEPEGIGHEGIGAEGVGPEGVGMDSLYARDASIVTDRGVILCAMGKDQRSGEPAAQEPTLNALGIPILGRIQGEGRVEGGDCVWLDESTLAVGRGYRTNAEGVRQLRGLLEPQVAVVEVPSPHFRGPTDVFHLMSMLSPVDADAVIVYSPTMPVPFRERLLERGLRLIEVPESEYDALGPNVLAIAPGVVLVVEGAPETADRLRAAGMDVISFAGTELCVKGCGGPTCLTRTLEREAPRTE
jgi:arginine deiminase